MSNRNSSNGTAGTPPLLEADPVSLRAPLGADRPLVGSLVRDLAPKRILVIDDDPTVRDLVALTVTRAGFTAKTAENGEEGWSALCGTAYDLVITDHEMPRLTGLKLIERMRAVSIEPPCILISGQLPECESALRKIVHRGAVLVKPFSPSELIERVYELLLTGEFQG